jgi:hypothetical protein
MALSRTWFFIILFLGFACAFFLPRVIWLSRSVAVTGHKYFTGHGNLGSVLGLSTYPVIRYFVHGDTLDFNGNINMPLQDGQAVAVRYQRGNPADARIATFTGLWADVLIYSVGPFLVIVALLLTPGLIPKRIRIGRSEKGGCAAE